MRERLAAQLLVALYRDGRRAEAMQVFHSMRRRLVERLRAVMADADEYGLNIDGRVGVRPT
jgi:hypothetical protein